LSVSTARFEFDLIIFKLQINYFVMVRLPSFFKKPVVAGFFVFLFVLILTQLVAYQHYLLFKDARSREMNNAVSLAKEKLQTALANSLSATQTLSFIVKKYGIKNDFDSVARQLIETNKFIDELELVEGGVITKVYPLKENAPAIGLDILNTPQYRTEALKAIEKRQLFFAGPLELKQGGTGIVGRLPVFMADTFWGFSVVVIRLPTLIKAAGIDNSQNEDYRYQLSKINPLTGKEEFFLPGAELFKGETAVSVDVPNGEWKIYVISKKPQVLHSLVPFSLLAFNLSFIIGVLAFFLFKKPVDLKKMVDEKSVLLSSAEENYHAMLERINDAFMAVDTEWRFTYINSRAAEILRRDPAELLGKNIWNEIPGMRESPLYNTYLRAMEQQQYEYVEGYTYRYTLWFENYLYPSPNGLSIMIRDITDRKRAEKEIQSEKEYSDSIIKSLPGVLYLYDTNGKFLRWNKNFETVTGYSGSEISTMHPLDFFEGEEKELVKERIADVFSTGSAEVEAYFRTKSGIKIPYYFNGYSAKFQGKDCLIGMGIDISARIKAEEQLKDSYDDIRLLNDHLETIREEERTGIAREIHDELGQQLTALKIDASWVNEKVKKGDYTVGERLNGMIALIDETVKTVRRIATDLRPGVLDDLGLIAALEWQSGDFEKRTGIKTVFTSQVSDMDIDKKAATGIFRVYQEVLTNVARHAKASLIETRVEIKDNVFRLFVRDNGIGFNMEEVKRKHTLGLIGMNERVLMLNGELALESNVGSGTRVVIKVPLNKK
jgi:PAS domain S-box-containing protein